MRNPSEEYDRLHDHCQAIARERDWAKHQLDEVKRLLDETTKQLHQAQDELTLAIEALVRARDIKP
jgi:chaperonin cofactor prefoldin